VRRLAAALALALALPAAPPAVPAAPRAAAGAPAAAAARVVLVVLDGTTLADWRRSSLPTLRGLLASGAAALLVARTPGDGRDARGARERAWRVLGSGSAARREGPGPSLLGRALARAGGGLVAVGGATAADATDRPARLLAGGDVAEPLRRDDAFPTGARTDEDALRSLVAGALERARLVVVDWGDPARIDRALGSSPAREAWVRLAMRRVDAFLAWLAGHLRDRWPRSLLAVASLVPPASERTRGRWTTAVALASTARRAPALLASPTTGRTGIASLADLAPTFLARLGVAPPENMQGRPLRTAPTRDPGGGTAALLRRIAGAARARETVLPGLAATAAVAFVLALLTVASGRGRPPAGAGRPTWRGALQSTLIALAAAPGAMLVAPALGVGPEPRGSTAACLAALVVAVAARAALGPSRALALAAGGSAALVALDLVTGARLALGSPVGAPVALGLRVDRLGDEAAGTLVAGALVAAAWALDRAASPPARGTLRRSVALGWAALAVLVALPQAGGRAPLAPVVLAAAGALLLGLRGRRPDRAEALGVAAVTVLTGAVAVALERSGAIRALGSIQGGGRPGLCATLSGAACGASAALVAIALSVGGLLALRRPALVGRATFGRPALRAALVAMPVAAAASLATSDAGIGLPVFLALAGGPALLVPLLAPDP
jgi:hypothetical protein